jgi:hypothetical protein
MKPNFNKNKDYLNTGVHRDLSQWKVIIVLFVLISFTYFCAWANLNSAPKFHFYYFDFMPIVGNEYTMNYEKKMQINALNHAISEFKKIDSKCQFTHSQSFPSTDDLFWHLLDDVANNHNPIVVGVGKSQQARITSKKLSNTKIPILSFAAASKELQELNKFAYSTSNPASEQVNAVLNDMKKSKCDINNTLILSNPSDTFSMIISSDVKSLLPNYKVIHNYKDIIDLNNYKCLYLTNSISNSKSDFEYLHNAKFRGLVYGVTEWSMIQKELNKIVSAINPSFQIKVPTGLNIDNHSKAMSTLKKMNVASDSDYGAFAVYVYEATLIGLASKCWNKSIEEIAVKNVKLPLVRKFIKMSKTGNLISSIEFIHYPVGALN